MTAELDDFVEYRIYRNGEFIGATTDTVFTDQLPMYGTYEYRVTAVYDPEGESIPSVAEVVSWNVVYRTFVTAPFGDVIGPIFQRSFTLGPQMYIHIPSVPVQVPANAPPGNYFLTGKLFYQGQPILEQTFQFDKMGGGE